MIALLKLFVDICLFQAKPQDLPASRALAGITGLIAIITSLRSLEQAAFALTTATMQVLLMGLIVHVALRFRGYPERWNQTISALYGATALINLVAMPIVGWMERVKESPEAVIWPALLGLGMTVWFVAIMAHVLRHALDLTVGAGVLLSIAFLALLLMASFILLIAMAT